MVVCKFFQQGSCRFGQSCRFEHIYGSKYSYHANAPPQNEPAPGVSDEQLMGQVISDIQAVLKGGQWPLSAYAPFKDCPNFPGFTDLSPEEARLFIYEAKANNTIDQAVGYINHLTKETMKKYDLLTQPSPKMFNLLRSLYKGENVPSPFTNTQQQTPFASSEPAANIFKNAVQSASVFGQSNASPGASIFGKPSTNNNTVFGVSPNNTPAKSIFSQASQSIFGVQSPQNNQNAFSNQNQANPASIFALANKSVFGSNNTTLAQNQPNNAPNVFQQQPNLSPFGQSPFAQANSQASSQGSIFGQSTQTSNTPFGQANAGNVFGQASPGNVFGQASPGNVFGQASPGNVFGQSTPSSVFGQQTGNMFGQQPNSEDIGVYSKLEALTEDDVEMFKSGEFQLGFVPELPPPHSLCI